MRLVTRHCACDCGQTFRCLKTSNARFFSELHEELFGYRLQRLTGKKPKNLGREKLRGKRK